MINVHVSCLFELIEKQPNTGRKVKDNLLDPAFIGWMSLS